MRESNKFLLIAKVLVAGFFATNAHAGLMLVGGVGRGSTTNPGALVDIDPLSGVGTVIGDSITPGGLTGLGFDSTGRLFGSSIAGPSGSRTSALVEIDPLTGAVISSVGITRSGIPISIGDLTVQPGTETIYGIQSNADNAGFVGGTLYTIDPVSGAVTVVGDPREGRSGGLAFAPDGTLFYLEFNELHVLDPLTASILSTTALDFGSHDGLGIHPDGTLYATGSGPTNDDVRIIDPVLGTSTLLGQSGVGALSDLAFFDDQERVPVPGTVFLVGAGLAVLGVRVRRRG